MTPDNTAPLMQEDLATCLACSAPAVAWRDGPGGAGGFCGSPVCEAEIAARARAAPAPRGCRVCSAPGVHDMGGFVICDSQDCAAAVERSRASA